MSVAADVAARGPTWTIAWLDLRVLSEYSPGFRRSRIRRGSARAVDGHGPSTKRHGQHAVEAGRHLVAVAAALDVAHHHEAHPWITIEYRWHRADVRVAVHQRQVGLARAQLGQRPAPLQLVAHPAEHGRGARV